MAETPTPSSQSKSPLSRAAAWRGRHIDEGSPAHECEPVEFKDAAGLVIAAFCGVCGRCISYRPEPTR